MSASSPEKHAFALDSVFFARMRMRAVSNTAAMPRKRAENRCGAAASQMTRPTPQGTLESIQGNRRRSDMERTSIALKAMTGGQAGKGTLPLR